MKVLYNDLKMCRFIPFLFFKRRSVRRKKENTIKELEDMFNELRTKKINTLFESLQNRMQMAQIRNQAISIVSTELPSYKSWKRRTICPKYPIPIKTHISTIALAERK